MHKARPGRRDLSSVFCASISYLNYFLTNLEMGRLPITAVKEGSKQNTKRFMIDQGERCGQVSVTVGGYHAVTVGGYHAVLLRSGLAVACGDDNTGACDIPILDDGLAYVYDPSQVCKGPSCSQIIAYSNHRTIV